MLVLRQLWHSLRSSASISAAKIEKPDRILAKFKRKLNLVHAQVEQLRDPYDLRSDGGLASWC